jgi:hypothetical protein
MGRLNESTGRGPEVGVSPSSPPPRFLPALSVSTGARPVKRPGAGGLETRGGEPAQSPEASSPAPSGDAARWATHAKRATVQGEGPSTTVSAVFPKRSGGPSGP